MRLRKLKYPCEEHGLYDEHGVWVTNHIRKTCPGGVFLAEDTLVIEKAPIEELHARIKDVEVLAYDGHHYSGASAAHLISPDELGRILDALAVREGEE